MDNRSTSVLIVAAGFSSRMGDFKPLMKMGGKTLIEHALNTFSTINTKHIVIITGHKSSEIEQYLEGRDIVFINNEHYGTTDMLHSVKLGMDYLNDKCDSVFIMPADVPLSTPFCAQEMRSLMQNKDAAIVKPTYKGRGGHPILIGSECFGHILGYAGEGGLKGALSSSQQEISTLPLPVPGIVMDADTQQSFELVRQMYSIRDIPSAELAMEILDWNDVGDSIRNHCGQVCRLAVSLAQLANEKGFQQNMRLIQASALLHDVERKTGSNHAQKGCALLHRMGYPLVAAVVSEHMDISAEALERMDERAIVYLADKLVQGDVRMRIESRLAMMHKKFSDDEGAVRSIKKRFDNARKVLNRLGINDEAALKL